MQRPPQELLALFYGLSELDAKRRHNSASQIIRKLKEDQTHVGYCIERLVSGICSNRAASRIGYSTCLSIVLQVADSNVWTTDKLLSLADGKMDLKDKTAGHAHAIGHHLLAVAIWNSGVYQESAPQLISEELTLLRHFPLLAASILAFFVEISKKLSAKQFKELVLTPLRGQLESAFQPASASPELIVFALELRRAFASSLQEHFPFVQADGSVKLEPEHCHALFAALKNCDRSYCRVFIQHLLSAAREAGQFELVYKEVIEKWTTNGDESKVLERIFDIASLCLNGSTDCLEILPIFSSELVKRLENAMRGKKDPHKRIIQEKVKTLYQTMVEQLGKTTNKEQLLKVLKHLDDLGNVDQMTNSRITADLILQLPEAAFNKYVKKLASQPDWALRRMSIVFGRLPTASQLHFLRSLCATEDQKQIVQSVVCQALDTLFYVMVRPGDSVQLHLSEENIILLEKLVTGFEEHGQQVVHSAKAAFETTQFKDSLYVLWLYLKVWSRVATNEEEQQQYADESGELVEIAEKAATKDSQALTVLLDLLFGLLSRNRKHHRTPAYYCYVHLLPHIKQEQLNHIVETMTMDDSELGDDAESSSDAEDEDESEGENAEDGESVDEEEDEQNEEVDFELVSSLKQALGKAAVNGRELENGGGDDAGSDSESSASPPELDDEEMLAMDERLAEAFRKMAPAFAKKEKSDAQKAASAFRSRLADLLLFTLSHRETPMKLKLGLIVPLVRLAKLQLKNESENSSGANVRKALELLGIAAHLKKGATAGQKTQLKEKQLVETLEGLKEEARAMTNPELASAVAQLACFILHTAMSTSTETLPTVKSAFVALFSEFMTQLDGSIGNELAVAAVLKYPAIFLEDLLTFSQAAFNDEYRIFRRTEAANCAASIVGALKNLDEEVSAVHQNSLKKLAKMAAEYLNGALENTQEVKPRFFATVLKLVHSLALSIAEDVKPVVGKNLLATCERLLESTEGQKILKKCNGACHQVCGRQSQSLLKAVVKSLKED